MISQVIYILHALKHDIVEITWLRDHVKSVKSLEIIRAGYKEKYIKKI